MEIKPEAFSNYPVTACSRLTEILGDNSSEAIKLLEEQKAETTDPARRHTLNVLLSVLYRARKFAAMVKE